MCCGPPGEFWRGAIVEHSNVWRRGLVLFGRVPRIGRMGGAIRVLFFGGRGRCDVLSFACSPPPTENGTVRGWAALGYGTAGAVL